jgi:uncharacterized protein
MTVPTTAKAAPILSIESSSASTESFAAHSRPSSGMNPIFVGTNGLRAGWRLLIFTVLVIALLFTSLVIRNGGIQGLKEAHARAGQITVTPQLMAIGEGIAFAVLCIATWIMSRIEHRRFSEYGLSARQALRKEFWIGSGSGFLALSSALLTTFLLHGFRITGLALHGTAIFSAMVAWGLAFITAGLCEEFLFHGYAQYTLGSGIGFWPAAFVLSGLFALGHAFNPNETAVGVAAVLLFGLLHSLFLRRTGSLWMAVGFHAGWDWGQNCFYGVPDSGIAPYHSVLHSVFAGPRWLTGGIVGPEASIFCPIALLMVALIFTRFYRENRYRELKPQE